MKKHIFFYISHLIILFLLSGCSKSDNFVGYWKSIPKHGESYNELQDIYYENVMEIKKKDGEYIYYQPLNLPTPEVRELKFKKSDANENTIIYVNATTAFPYFTQDKSVIKNIFGINEQKISALNIEMAYASTYSPEAYMRITKDEYESFLKNRHEEILLNEQKRKKKQEQMQQASIKCEEMEQDYRSNINNLIGSEIEAEEKIAELNNLIPKSYGKEEYQESLDRLEKAFPGESTANKDSIREQLESAIELEPKREQMQKELESQTIRLQQIKLERENSKEIFNQKIRELGLNCFAGFH